MVKEMKKVIQMRLEIPTDVHKVLKDLAVEERRSLQSQVMYILEQTADVYVSAKKHGLERFK